MFISISFMTKTNRVCFLLVDFTIDRFSDSGTTTQIDEASTAILIHEDVTVRNARENLVD